LDDIKKKLDMAFKKFGQIESINVKYNKERKKPYAFINFTDEEST
jgi:RNA recognition motif-containing protein